jgi:hypothetical protein
MGRGGPDLLGNPLSSILSPLLRRGERKMKFSSETGSLAAQLSKGFSRGRQESRPSESGEGQRLNKPGSQVVMAGT